MGAKENIIGYMWLLNARERKVKRARKKLERTSK